MTRYILLLGGNLGDSEKALDTAIRFVRATVGAVVAESSRLLTSAIGKGLSGDFLNQALLVESSLSPEQLLDAVESIERKMGRDKPVSVEWDVADRVFSDRIIDIDIALADFAGGSDFKGEWHSSRLSIPHRALNERPFVGQLISELV